MLTPQVSAGAGTRPRVRAGCVRAVCSGPVLRPPRRPMRQQEGCDEYWGQTNYPMMDGETAHLRRPNSPAGRPRRGARSTTVAVVLQPTLYGNRLGGSRQGNLRLPNAAGQWTRSVAMVQPVNQALLAAACPRPAPSAEVSGLVRDRLAPETKRRPTRAAAFIHVRGSDGPRCWKAITYRPSGSVLCQGRPGRRSCRDWRRLASR